MSNNSQENRNLTLNDAVDSLLSPLTDTANDEQQELEVAQPVETELETEVEDNSQEPEILEEDEVVEADDTEEEEVEEEVEEQPQLYTVKIDGEDVEVTLDELRNGYSRTSVFTKRQQELAEQRKSLEAEMSQATQIRDAYAQQLEVLKNQIQQTTQAEPDWRALAEQGYNEKELFLAKAEYDKNQQELVRIQQEQQRIAQEQNIENEKKVREHLNAQRQEMLERLPQWKDDDKRNNERVEVIKYAQQRIGFSEEEITNVTDARAIEVIYKAWQWDKLQEKTPNVKKRTRKAPKMAKAGQPKTKTQVANRVKQQAMDRLNKEKSVGAAVDYLMSRKN